MDYADYSILSMRDVWSLYQNTKKFDMSSDAGRLGLTSDPQISPDGLTIAYTRTIGTKTNIYTAVFADRGRTVTQLTDSGKDSASCWSPDSKWILFTSTRDDNAEIYIMPSAACVISWRSRSTIGSVCPSRKAHRSSMRRR